MYTLKIRKIGGSYGAIFPKEALNELCVKEGDAIYLVKDEMGDLKVTAYDAEFENEMKIFKKFRTRYKNALRELSKH